MLNETDKKTYNDYIAAVYYTLIRKQEIAEELFNYSDTLERERFETVYDEFIAKLDSAYGIAFADNAARPVKTEDPEMIEQLSLCGGPEGTPYEFAAEPGNFYRESPELQRMLSFFRSSAEFGMEFLFTFNLFHMIIEELVPGYEVSTEIPAAAVSSAVAEGRIQLRSAASEQESGNIKYICDDLDCGDFAVSIIKNRDDTYSFGFKPLSGSFRNKVVEITLTQENGEIRTIRKKCRQDLPRFWMLCKYPVSAKTGISYSIKESDE